MELVNLMKKISNNDIPHFLIFFGEEQKIIDIYIQNIVQSADGKKVVVDNVSQAVKDNGKKSLDKSIKVYVATEDTTFLTKDESWENVRKSMHKNYLILRYHSLDKRSAFVRKNQQNIVEFSHLSYDVLQQYIYRDLPDLSDENASKLISYCNNDYGRILLEVDKIKQYNEYIACFTNGISIDKCFEELDKQGLFHKEIGDITFELTGAVLGGYPEKAIQKLDEAKRKGEPAMMIASILYNGFRNLLAYQGLGKNKQGAMERTGMTKGELYGCTKNVGGYNVEEVKRNMLFCQKVESGIKMGTIDEDIALEYLVLSCLK